MTTALPSVRTLTRWTYPLTWLTWITRYTSDSTTRPSVLKLPRHIAPELLEMPRLTSKSTTQFRNFQDSPFLFCAFTWSAVNFQTHSTTLLHFKNSPEIVILSTTHLGDRGKLRHIKGQKFPRFPPLFIHLYSICKDSPETLPHLPLGRTSVVLNLKQ